jgi:hypothetical protein
MNPLLGLMLVPDFCGLAAVNEASKGFCDGGSSAPFVFIRLLLDLTHYLLFRSAVGLAASI